MAVSQRVFYHGTTAVYAKPRLDQYGAYWLALTPEVAALHASAHYKKGAPIVLKITLKPSAKILDLSDLNDPIVREYKEEVSARRKYTWGPISDEAWESFADFGLVESAIGEAAVSFKANRVDGIMCNDEHKGIKYKAVALFRLGSIASLESLGQPRENPSTPSNMERARVRKVIKDWQWHKRPFEDTEYWTKRFAPFENVFAKTRPSKPVQLYRSERTDIDNQYETRFTSWSLNDQAIHGFGWGERRMVVGAFRPEDILVDLTWLDLDSESMQEVLVRPGAYDIRPFKLVWSRTGASNAAGWPEVPAPRTNPRRWR